MRQKKPITPRTRRALRVRARIRGTAERPRLSIFRSANALYSQLIDDSVGKTLISASTRGIQDAKTKTDAATMLGTLIAEHAKKAGITKAILDRGSYKYHGRVRAFAEGARKGGLTL